jgi:hypothetical protein
MARGVLRSCQPPRELTIFKSLLVRFLTAAAEIESHGYLIDPVRVDENKYYLHCQ